jgi:hypothetical protein
MGGKQSGKSLGTVVVLFVFAEAFWAMRRRRRTQAMKHSSACPGKCSVSAPAQLGL